MPPRFLADENLNAKIIAGLLRREPAIDFQTARDAGLFGLPDEEVLAVAARENRILVTHDRETMPVHFARFIVDTTSTGVLIISQTGAIRDAIEQILMIWSASQADEWRNQLVYLPL